MDEPRAKTPDELRDEILDHMRYMAKYWAEVKLDNHETIQSRIEGFGHSVLAILDGCALELPAFDLVAKTHPDEKPFHIENGDNWIDDETRISDALREHWYKPITPKG